jgi:two-component system LytT family sensor kinase
MIPILSIQPLVENAVKHGIAAKAGHGRVCVTVSVSAMGLSVSVADTGVGFEESGRHPRDGAGVGLENVRRRLALYYGPAADLSIHSTAGGTTVGFLIPTPVEAGMSPLAVTS